MKLLFIGDVFGKPGRRAVQSRVPGLIEEHGIHFVIANGENIAGGKGLTPETCEELYASGVNVVTTGNHVTAKREVNEMLGKDPRLLRPINYPDSMPGVGYVIRSSRNGSSVGVVNSIGAVFITKTDSPFVCTREAVEELRKKTPIVIVDFHAEATSEKRAMGWYLDGLATAVLGTHTHVQTADEEILPAGTAYISDAGMTGPHDSVIGLKKELALEGFLRGKRSKFEVGKNDVRLCGVIVDIDDVTGRARAIARVCERL